jgi:hypothetical protein
MNTNEYTKFSALKIDANCTTTVHIHETTDDALIKITNKDPQKIKISDVNTNGELAIEVMAEEKNTNVPLGSISSAIQQAISKDSIKDFIPNFISGLKQTSGSKVINNDIEIVFDVFIPKAFLAIHIAATNLDLDIHHSSIINIDVKSSNLDFTSTQPLTAQLLKITSPNSNVDFIAANGLAFAEVDGNNCDLTIRRTSDFNGKIKIKGSNTDISGNCDGDPTKGLITCCMSNANVSILSK